MAENNKDGYVQHANVGRRSIIDIDEANSNFEVADNKITGIAKGSITKEYQGNTDNFQLNLNNIPFIGGGGSGGSNVAHYWFAENVQFVDDPENPGSKYMVSAWNVFSEKPEATIGEYEASMYGYPVTWNGNKVETAEPLLGDIDNGSVIAITRLRIIDTFDPETSESLGPKVSCDATYTINGFDTYDSQALFTFNYTSLNPKRWVGTTYVGYLLCSLTGPANWQVRINYSSGQ